MLERQMDLPTGIVGLKATGKVSKQDYAQVVVPLLNEARRDGRRIRLLYQLGPEFDGFSAGAAWADTKIGLQSMGLFDGCALVTDVGWITELTRLSAFLIPCPVRVYGNRERAEAVAWLSSLPERAAISARLLSDSGVIVVEVDRALRVQDFDALELMADEWIDAHGELQGITIHAREFPGWENLGSLLRHVQFVRDHHRKVRRVALAADSKLASLAPLIGEHFVKSEIKGFGYDELAAAVAWASGKPGQPTSMRSSDGAADHLHGHL